MANIDLTQLIQSANFASAAARKHEQQISGIGMRVAEIQKEFGNLRDALSRVEISSRMGDPGIQRVENIPGRRVPFDLLVDIPIAAGSTAVQQGTITISQEGPFVAVSRFATLLSAYEYTYTEPGTSSTTRYQGRSYGRYRPIHSAWDLNDGNPIATTTLTTPPTFPGTGAPLIVSPSNASSFRTMEGDFRIKFENAGSSFPRSNLEVPSPFWTKSINEAFDLGALDVFERGEVLSFRVLPLHAANASYGNLAGYGTGDYPYIESQWDAVEGIDDTVDAEATVDPITRYPNSILTIGFHGYRIIQQPGVVY
jgi:hypothetical protein